MNAQKSRPKMPSMANRAPRPRCSATDRARAVSHLGHRRWRSEGSGRSMTGTECRIRGGAASEISCIEHLDELTRRVLARELEEDVFESGTATRGMPAQFR